MQYDGDPSYLAQAIAEVIRTQTGQEVTVRVNRYDAAGTSTKIAAVQAAEYVKRRPEI